MLLPYRDAPNPEGRPLVTWLLIAANVLVFVAVTLPLAGAQLDLADPVVRRAIAAHPELLASLARGGSVGPYDLFLFDWGFIPAEASVRTLFASMFLHGGFMHLFGNMLFLWIYGDNVEARLGRVGYLAAYLGTGVAATATQAVFDLSSTTPMVGASGAISGVLGLYFVFFPRNVVHVFVALFPFFLQTIQVPARLALGFYLVFQNLLPVFFGAGGSVAHGAHIGGFVGGLGLAYLVGARGAERAPHARVPARPGASSRPPRDEDDVEALVARGRMQEAAQRYFALDGRVPLGPQRALALAQWLADAGHPTAAIQVFERVASDPSTRPRDAAWGHLGAGFVLARDVDDPEAARERLERAVRLDPRGEAGARAAELLARLDGAAP